MPALSIEAKRKRESGAASGATSGAASGKASASTAEPARKRRAFARESDASPAKESDKTAAQRATASASPVEGDGNETRKAMRKRLREDPAHRAIARARLLGALASKHELRTTVAQMKEVVYLWNAISSAHLRALGDAANGNIGSNANLSAKTACEIVGKLLRALQSAASSPRTYERVDKAYTAATTAAVAAVGASAREFSLRAVPNYAIEIVRADAVLGTASPVLAPKGGETVPNPTPEPPANEDDVEEDTAAEADAEEEEEEEEQKEGEDDTRTGSPGTSDVPAGGGSGSGSAGADESDSEPEPAPPTDAPRERISITAAFEEAMTTPEGRMRMTKYYADMFNRNVFSMRFPADCVFKWMNATVRRAGSAACRYVHGVKTYIIRLSVQLIGPNPLESRTSIARLMEVLAHEMCHVMNYVDGDMRAGHGPKFAAYGKLVMSAYPAVRVKNNHDFNIEMKYVFNCFRCAMRVRSATKNKRKCRGCRNWMTPVAVPALQG